MKSEIKLGKRVERGRGGKWTGFPQKGSDEEREKEWHTE